MNRTRLSISLILKRNTHSEIRKKLKEKKSAKALALEYFDFYYSTTFGNEWNGIRLAMLTGRKYTALVNNYSIWYDTCKNLEQIASVNLFDFLSKYNKQEHIESKLKIPKSLKVYTFDNGNTSEFPSPKSDINRLSNYYCIDGASLLPVIALDIQEDDQILDLCASPGGKSLAMLQTLLPKHITCRDISSTRLDRLNRMLNSYLKKEDLDKLVDIQINLSLSKKTKDGLYDKVLVDVPCTNDRHSLHNEDNNIFSKNRNEERASISKKQAELLTQAIVECKLNGTIVYSTCSLSPIQNDGVVNAVVNSFEGNSRFKLKIEPLDNIKEYFSYFFNFSSTTNSGLLVAPDINKNFGPFYLSKITKLKI